VTLEPLLLIPKDAETHRVVTLVLSKFIREISSVTSAPAREKLQTMLDSVT
jgi:hypothetical protein